MERLAFLSIALLAASLPVAAQIPGRNVNMVSGTKWPEGDPFLQRQNEPSIAVSSRNPLHILSGANDYRTVDLPGLPEAETGDAWLGIFKSYDGGQTWRSTVHPGCAQNVPQCDGAPLLKDYPAGADPVVRAGTNGMFYYSGIGFTRSTPKKSVVFVSRFIDNNNEENGDPIKYVSTVPVGFGDDKLFVDKPWLAVDIPRAGAGACEISVPRQNGNPLVQKFPAGNVYLAYTLFTDESRPPSQIQFARSRDCGATWSKPITVADNSLNQGATLAIDPASGAVYVAWRRFKAAGLGDAILFVQSTDGGQTFSSPLEVAAISPFDQGTTVFSFRTNAYPAMAVDGSGRVYLAWSERGYGTAGDARIVLTTSRDGQHWTPRAPVSDFPSRGHQFMPGMTFGGGKLMAVFYDLRQDSTVGVFTASGAGQYQETRAPAGDLATNPPRPDKVFTNFVLDAAPADLNAGGLLRRHTIDVWAAQADPDDAPKFSTARVSQYIFGSRAGSKIIEQLQVNPLNLPLFKQGTAPFFGDYLDVTASPSLVPGDQPGTWKFNTDPSKSIAFHAIWTDNRDVRPPANGDWTDYTPPTSAANRGMSIFDPTQPQPACRTGQAGMRNQNIYTARITQGLLVSSPSNAKTLGSIQRSFPVIVYNSTGKTRTYRFTIANQPKGGKASFLQVPVAGLPDPLTVLDVNVSSNSSVSRMVFVRSTDPLARVRVNVDEVSAAGAPDVLAGGLQGAVVLNPDPLNPDNADLSKAEVFNPDIANPDIANPDIANPDIANPDIANPDIANPDIANPDIANPDIANPDIANPDIANPDIANPDIANPDIANASISDATWKLTNHGNATATYTIQFLLNGNIPGAVRSQLIVHRTYTTPVSNGCTLMEQSQTVVVANISNPTFLTPKTAGKLFAMILARAPAGANGPAFAAREYAAEIIDDSLDNATVSVGPGETVNITLRFYNPDKNQPLGFDPGAAITTVSISHSTNTGDNQLSVAASHLIVASTSLPAAVAGAGYAVSLVAAGGTQPYAWSLLGGALPPGLDLSSTGVISGVTSGSAAGVYNFTVQVTDSSSPAQKPVSQALSIQVSQVALSIAGLSATGPAGPNVKPGDNITVSVSVTNAGSAADSVAPSLTANATGTASANCNPPDPLAAPIPSGASQSYTITCGSVTGIGTLTFSVGILAIDHASGAGIAVSPATSNVVTVLGAPPTVTASATAGGNPYSSGAWTNQNVIVKFTCTPAIGAPTVKTVTVISEGANQTVNTTCDDLAGNTASALFSGINIDRTPPQVVATATINGAPYSGAPTNQNVYITFTCTDPGGSGPADLPPPQLFQAEGLGQSATGVCTDVAGNTGSATFSPINIAKSPPQVTAEYAAAGGEYSPGAWSNQPVTVSFDCLPAAGLGIASLTAPVTVSTDGGNQFVTGRCTDLAGNFSQITVGPIRIDRTPPVLSLISRTPANASGWNNSNVTLTWSCFDQLSGTTNIPRTVSTEGPNQTVTASCSDLAGNSASASEVVSLDKTPPVIAGLASPAPNAGGWYAGPVTVSFTCSDGLSGVALGNPSGGTTLTADTNGSTVTGACLDVAGNAASFPVGPIRIDRTPPVVQFQSVSPITAAGWSNGPVTVTWSCIDSGSGPVSPIVTQIVTGSGANLSATATCTDLVGNSASDTHTGIKIDTVAPLIQFLSPIDGFNYTQGASVIANYSCSDGGSGIASCTGTAPNAQRQLLNTLGTFTFTVTAIDNAGNQTQVTHTYHVVAP